LDELDKVEKSILEKENQARIAREDLRNLSGEIALKESRLNSCKEGAQMAEKQLSAVAAR